MNTIEDNHKLFEHCLNIEGSNKWSFNDLLQYALELIISGEDDCIPTNISDIFCSVRENMLTEIENAVSEQKKNNDLPPMPNVASSISCLGVFLKKEELDELEKLLNGDYRRKRGEKIDADKTKETDISRLFIYRGYLATRSPSDAVGELADQEGIDDSSARKAIRRGGKYLKEILHSLSEAQGFDRADSFNYLRRQIIKNEIKKLLLRSRALKFNKLIKKAINTHKRGT